VTSAGNYTSCGYEIRTATFSRPYLNLLCDSKTFYFFVASPSQAAESIAQMSLALFPNFTENLMFIVCTKNWSLNFFYET